MTWDGGRRIPPAEIQCPDIDWDRGTIRWTARSSPGFWFVVSVSDFLWCGVIAKSEADFRAKLYKLGKMVEKNPKAKVARA